ncbi:37055_t:CDS:1, partial [Racocetra persica]
LHKVDQYRDLDRLINMLSLAKEKYLPLTEYRYSVKKVFEVQPTAAQIPTNIQKELSKHFQ